MLPFILAAALIAADTTVRVAVFPARPVIERDGGTQYLNFDFGLTNTGDRPREVRRIELSVFDSRNGLVHRQFVSATGAASPGLLTVSDRTIPANGSLNIFNPFFALPSHLEIGRLHFEFTFETRAIEPIASVAVDVVPGESKPAVRLVLPVDGPAILYDGHDFYSHHRRIPLGSAFARDRGLSANPVRYANDWTPVGPNGELARGSLADPTGWYAYGAPVRAPATGIVVSAFNDVPDNRIDGEELVMPPEVRANELKASLGNHVVLKHREGVYTLLAHLKAGTVSVAVGDTVRQGAPVGQIGFSGDTGFHVHVHQMLMTTPSLSGEGLPSYFDRVRRVALANGVTPYGPILSGARLDTGDLVVGASGAAKARRPPPS
jgi:hypothetical protein